MSTKGDMVRSRGRFFKILNPLPKFGMGEAAINFKFVVRIDLSKSNLTSEKVP